MIRADLHVHTFYSDGFLTPAEVMKTAKENGVQLISVTDHDTALGADEAQKAAKEYGLKFVNGIEVSAYKNGVKLHTLGYNLNLNCPDFKDFCTRLFKGSQKRAEDIIYKLNKNGVSLRPVAYTPLRAHET